MVLLPLLESASCRCAAVAGTVKNAGKTAALNTLVAEAGAAGIRVGVTSSGRDGERADAVFGHEKPPVRLPAGALVLTYSGLAKDNTPIFPLKTLDIHPVYGRLILAVMKRAGEVVLAGPVTRSRMSAGLEALAGAGAELVLVDGSIDRRGFIDAGVIKSIILATGMALGSTPGEAARKTAYLVEIFSLPLWQGELPGSSSCLLDGRWAPLGAGTLPGDEKRLAGAVPAEARALFLGGALTDRLLLALKEEKRYLPIVLKSPSSFFAGREYYLSYRGGGGEVKVAARPGILAVTTNPWGHGVMWDPAELAEAVKKAVPGLPVVDVVRRLVL